MTNVKSALKKLNVFADARECDFRRIY